MMTVPARRFPTSGGSIRARRFTVKATAARRLTRTCVCV